MTRGIGEGRTFLLASETNISSLREIRDITEGGTQLRELTVFFREMKVLRDAGYVRFGNSMIPGANWIGF
jgi:hypothetical protein